MVKADGWIKLHRELLEKAIWRFSTPEQKVILITLLMMANHEPKEWEWKGKKFMCNPGQMITSLRSIKKIAGKGISIKNIRTCLQRFQKYEFLAYKSAKTGRLVTIINWESYQSNKNRWQGNRQTGGKQVATNKNDKNDKNKEKIYKRESVCMKESEYQKLCTSLGKDIADTYIDDLNLYIQSTGKKYKSHYAVVLNWHRRDLREGRDRLSRKNMTFEQKVMTDTR
jgi:hypothetical protein